MKLKFLQILVCLAVIYGSCSVEILQSTTNTKIVSPAGANVVVSSYYNSLEANKAGQGVDWITIQRPPTVYQNVFYSSCIGDANLTITAATSFNVYLDGVHIGNGSNYAVSFNFPIKITCGNHNLTIVVYYTEGVSEGLTFGINQDQSECYNCQATGYWNENSCSCLCITNQCPCTAPKIWKGYPICGCGCPTRIFLDDAAGTASTAAAAGNKTADSQSDLLRIRPLCLLPRYYSQDTCSCVCHFRYCPPRYYFDQANCRCTELIP